MEVNKIYHEDCFVFLDKTKNNSIDLVVIDPPYNLSKAGWDTFKSDKDFFDFTFGYLKVIIKKMKEKGSLYIFNTPRNAAYILSFLEMQGLIFQNWICWNKKDGMTAPKRKYANGQETILFFTKSNSYVFNYDDIRIPYESSERIEHAKKKGILKNGKRWYPNAGGKLCREVWEFSSERHKNKVNGKLVKQSHLTPKPLDMVSRIIKASSNEQDLVLDCFMGSGTTAVACKKLNRNFIGCEQNEEYYKLSIKRINDIENE